MSKPVGCLGVIIGLVIVVKVAASIEGCVKEHIADCRQERIASELATREKLEAQRAEAAAEEAERERMRLAEQRRFNKENGVRTFALKEAPLLWNTYQALQAELTNQTKRVEALRIVLEDFDRNPDRDDDFKNICRIRDEIKESLSELKKKLIDAYIAAKKFEATPSRKDYDELRRRILEDGIKAAEDATERFKVMAEGK